MIQYLEISPNRSASNYYCIIIIISYITKIIFLRDNDWWLARNLSNLAEGYIPKNHVALATSLECQEWVQMQ